MTIYQRGPEHCDTKGLPAVPLLGETGQGLDPGRPVLGGQAGQPALGLNCASHAQGLLLGSDAQPGPSGLGAQHRTLSPPRGPPCASALSSSSLCPWCFLDLEHAFTRSATPGRRPHPNARTFIRQQVLMSTWHIHVRNGHTSGAQKRIKRGAESVPAARSVARASTAQTG